MVTNLQVDPLNIRPCIFYYLLLLHSVSQLSVCKSSLTPWTSRQFIAGRHRKTICTHTKAQFQVHSSSHAQDFGLPAERSHMDTHTLRTEWWEDFSPVLVGVSLTIRVTQCWQFISLFLFSFTAPEPVQSPKASMEGEVHSEPLLWQPRHSGGGAVFQGGPENRGVFGNVSPHSDGVCVCACVCFLWLRDESHTPPNLWDKDTMSQLQQSCVVSHN